MYSVSCPLMLFQNSQVSGEACCRGLVVNIQKWSIQREEMWNKDFTHTFQPIHGLMIQKCCESSRFHSVFPISMWTISSNIQSQQENILICWRSLLQDQKNKGRGGGLSQAGWKGSNFCYSSKCALLIFNSLDRWIQTFKLEYYLHFKSGNYSFLI